MGYTPREDRFPYFEMGILFFASVLSSIPIVSIFPYVAFMMVDMGVSRTVDEAGYVSGYIASAFMLGRLLSSFHWGHVADKIGRKPVMYVGCSSLCIFSFLFGCSANIWMALLSRFLMGLCNPMASLNKTMISEICCKKYQASGMALAAVRLFH